MTRTITLIIAALALVGCQEGSGLEEAPEGQGEDGADIEQASALSGAGVSSVADAPSKEQLASAQLAAKSAMCADMAEQHKALLEQIKAVQQQQSNAARMMAELEAQQPVRKGFEDDETYHKALATHRAKVDAAKHKVAYLDAQLASLVDKEKELHDKMAKAGCKDIPPPPKPSPAPGGTSASGSASSSSQDSTIRNMK
ncbi:MAG: hypothetical protein JRF63_01075 [Deltaproteobacteria bacterium]|nr:hypothetical protein [Deltaproteobacteria bacterium]